jgi:hypothetical protein
MARRLANGYSCAVRRVITEGCPNVDILGELEKNGQPDSYEQGTIMRDKRPLIWISLFWGSLWGMTEATLGHILHQIPIPGIAGYVMFPVGIFFMVKAFRHSGKLPAIFLTALVAANIKLVNLFLPAHSPFAAVNPALAIICESFAVGLFFGLRDFKKILSRLDSAFGLVFVWRLIYGLMIMILSAGFISPVRSFTERGSAPIVGFFFLETIINAVLVYAFFHKYKFPQISGRFLFLKTQINKSCFFRYIFKYPALNTIPLVIVAIALELLLF